MKIGIIGCRGIPNHHGGFEQFAEYFAVFLAQKNIDVTVYNSSLHPYKEGTYKEVKIIHCNDPENKMGAAGQFIYDLNCILDARKRKFDIILQLGYTSSSIWYALYLKKTIVITNMDGLEWKRSKYKYLTKKFLKYAEKLAALKSDYLISDSIGIKKYLLDHYNKDSKFIAYGATLFNNPDDDLLSKFDLTPYQYNLVIARIEPENNIETIINGSINDTHPTLIIGDDKKTKFGRFLRNKFHNNENIRFLGAIYDTKLLNNLRYFSKAYFHGHSVGGTNPSLLEAMSSNALIIAHNNNFNKSILENNALYFDDSEDIVSHLEEIDEKEYYKDFIVNNRKKIKNKYSWSKINEEYLSFFQKLIDEN